MAQATTPVPPAAAISSRARQAITGVMPPQLGEARIREEWPTLLGVNAPLATLAKGLVKSVILAPLGFLLMLPLFVLKFGPFVCKRYTLTNRRLMVQRGWKPSPVQEVALADIDEVRFDPNGVDPYYVSGNLEVVSNGRVVLRLDGVPEPEGVRHAVVNSVKAWVPGKASGPFVPASSIK